MVNRQDKTWSWCGQPRGPGFIFSAPPEGIKKGARRGAPLTDTHSRHSGGGEGPTAEKRRAGDVTPVVHVSVLAVIATLLRHNTLF